MRVQKLEPGYTGCAWELCESCRYDENKIDYCEQCLNGALFLFVDEPRGLVEAYCLEHSIKFLSENKDWRVLSQTD